MQQQLKTILENPAWRHLTSGDFWACDVCFAMGKCDCKIKDMTSESISIAISQAIEKDYVRRDKIKIDAKKARGVIKKNANSLLIDNEGDTVVSCDLTNLAHAISSADIIED